MLSDQTKNYTAEIKSVASLAGSLKNYDSKFAEIETTQSKMRDTNDLKFQQMADKIAALQDWVKILKNETKKIPESLLLKFGVN